MSKLTHEDEISYQEDGYLFAAANEESFKKLKKVVKETEEVLDFSNGKKPHNRKLTYEHKELFKRYGYIYICSSMEEAELMCSIDCWLQWDETHENNSYFVPKEAYSIMLPPLHYEKAYEENMPPIDKRYQWNMTQKHLDILEKQGYVRIDSSKEESMFQTHAVQNHPRSKVFFSQIGESNL